MTQGQQVQVINKCHAKNCKTTEVENWVGVVTCCEDGDREERGTGIEDGREKMATKK